MIAAGGRRSRTLAGQLADIVTFSHGPFASRQEVKQMITATADAAGDRAGQIEYNMNILVLGDAIPRPIVPLVGDDLSALIDRRFLAHASRNDPPDADEIQRRRDMFGYSYITVNARHLDNFAPVIELLHSR